MLIKANHIDYNTLFIGVIVKCSTFLLVSSVSTKGQTKCCLTVSCFAVIDNQRDSVRKEPSKPSLAKNAIKQTFWSRKSALAARAKIRPPCTLKHRAGNKSTTVCLLTHWIVFLKANCPWIISNGCLQNWSFRAFEILYPVLENASEMDTPF